MRDQKFSFVDRRVSWDAIMLTQGRDEVKDDKRVDRPRVWKADRNIFEKVTITCENIDDWTFEC